MSPILQMIYFGLDETIQLTAYTHNCSYVEMYDDMTHTKDAHIFIKIKEKQHMITNFIATTILEIS